MFRPVCFSACQWHPEVVEINKGCGRRGKGKSTDPSKTNKTSKVANDGAVTAVKPSDQFSFSSRVSSFPCCPSLPKPTHIILICLFDLSTPKQPFRYPIVPLFARHILVPSTPGDMLPFYQIAGNDNIRIPHAQHGPELIRLPHGRRPFDRLLRLHAHVRHQRFPIKSFL